MYSAGPVTLISHCGVLVPLKLIPASETVTCRRQPRPAVPELLRLPSAVCPVLFPPSQQSEQGQEHDSRQDDAFERQFMRENSCVLSAFWKNDTTMQLIGTCSRIKLVKKKKNHQLGILRMSPDNTTPLE